MDNRERSINEEAIEKPKLERSSGADNPPFDMFEEIEIEEITVDGICGVY